VEGGTVDADVDTSLAWDITQGSADIVIAVIDDGFDMSHPDLAPNLWVNTGEVPSNGVDDDGNGFIDDINGFDFKMNDGNPAANNVDYHGTHTAGVAAALGNNALGVTGVNWDAAVMPIQGLSGNEAIVVAAYGYALTMRQIYNDTNGAMGAFVASPKEAVSWIQKHLPPAVAQDPKRIARLLCGNGY
jgi:subtilisin family serine protease